MSNNIVVIIQQYIDNHSISGNQFSYSIGFDPAMWCRIRRRITKPSPSFLASIARTYPELRLQIQESMFGTEENDGN